MRNDLVRRSVYEDAKVHDKTIWTHHDLVERDRKRVTDHVIQSVMRSGSASQAVQVEFE